MGGISKGKFAMYLIHVVRVYGELKVYVAYLTCTLIEVNGQLPALADLLQRKSSY